MSEFSYLPLSDVSRSSRKSPGSGSEINGSSSSASGNALCLLGHSNGQVAQGEVPDPVLSTATVATTPPSTESSCRSSPSSAVTSPSPLSTIGHTHIPLRRDITSSPRRVSSTRVGSMTGMKNQGGGAPSSTSGFQGLGAHLNYMLNRDSRSTGNLANPINSIGNSTINSNALSESSSSGGILKNKLLKSNRNSLGDSLQPKSQSSDIGTPLMTPRGSPSPSQMSRTPSVKETHHISIDYDPVSGRKQLNTYEIIKELGRGQHGKVKLAKDLETGEFVVSVHQSVGVFFFLLCFSFVFNLLTRLLKL